jgi:transposase
MEREDARKLSPAEQLERRRQVVRAWKRGRNRRQIAADVGLSYSAVRATINSYKKLGARGLESGQRGRPVASSRKLTDEQEQLI